MPFLAQSTAPRDQLLFHFGCLYPRKHLAMVYTRTPSPPCSPSQRLVVLTASCEFVFTVIQMGLFASSSPNLEWSTFVWNPASAISSATSDKSISEVSSDLSTSWVHFIVDISSAISSGVSWNRIYFKGYSETGVLFHLDRIWLVPSGMVNSQALERICTFIAFVDVKGKGKATNATISFYFSI